VTETADRALLGTQRRRLTPLRSAWLGVLLLPLLLNCLGLLGIAATDPVLRYSNLQAGIVAGPLGGLPVIDPNVGFTFQALGKRSADEILAGKLPWWNSDAGVGLPLAGEMQPGSFYPLVLLEELPNGQTLIDIVSQILCGAFTLLLLRRLGLGLLAATAGALLFECNGTFAWLRAGEGYPLPYLPLLLYGIELAVGSERKERIAGSVLVAASLCFSIVAAMIEVAYLDALLCVAWALLRLAQTAGAVRLERGLRLTFGALIGLLAASPLLIAFGDYLRVANVGPHSGVGYVHLDPLAVPQTLLPYLWGPIFRFNNADIARLWGSVGGYAGLAVTFAAVCGLFGRYRRGLRILLGLWTLGSFGATVGMPVVQDLMLLLPGVKYTAYDRYLDASREFALALLVAFFIHDVAVNRGREWGRYAAATLLVVFALGAGLVASSPVWSAAFALAGFAKWFWCSLGAGAVALALLWTILCLVPSGRSRAAALAAVVVCEAAANYFLPTLSFPSQGRLIDGSVAFLREHLGLNRLYALGPIAPNYGSYFDVAQINHNEIPVASRWTTFVTGHLDPYINPVLFTGDQPVRGASVPYRDEVLRENLAAFEGVGVKYVVSFHGSLPLTRSFQAPLGQLSGQGIAPLRLLDAHASVRIQLGGLPAGPITDIGISQGNYDGRADGQLVLRACSGDRCVRGARPFSESANNQFFLVHLERPLPVTGGSLSVDARQSGASFSDALWLVAGAQPGSERLFVDGTELPGRAAQLQFLYAAKPGAGEARTVYRDDLVDIDELPQPAPYFSAPGCTLAAESRERVYARCAGSAALTRRELFMPGWTAWVNGTHLDVEPAGELFEAVSLPAGNSTVTFDFTPPYMDYGYAAFTLGILTFAYQLFAYVRLHRSREVAA
jgi:hypothetical protein